MASLEKRIVSSVLKSKEAYLKIKNYLELDNLTPYGTAIVKIADGFYAKDAERKSVDIEYVIDKLAIEIDGDKKRDLYVSYAKECYDVDVSAINVAALILETQKKERGQALAQYIANGAGTDSDTIAKIDEYKELLETNSLGEKENDIEIFHAVPVEVINKSVLSKDGLIKLLSKQMTDAIDGGALRQHHITVFARPETGKTALVLSMMRVLGLQKLKGIYFGNEDPINSIIERYQACLTGMSRVDRLRDPAAANAVLKAQGYEYVKFVPLAPGTCEEIDRIVQEEEPVWIVVDQMRNLGTKAENRTNQLEKIATDLRNIGKRRDCLVISVTQAGDSATNKLTLEQGDIDSSNTGIPAQADLMIGLGSNSEHEQQHWRVISLPKNKLSGKHISFRVKINEQISRIEDL